MASSSLILMIRKCGNSSCAQRRTVHGVEYLPWYSSQFCSSECQNEAMEVDACSPILPWYMHLLLQRCILLHYFLPLGFFFLFFYYFIFIALMLMVSNDEAMAPVQVRRVVQRKPPQFETPASAFRDFAHTEVYQRKTIGELVAIILI
jgi:hypothetical protein